MEIVMLNQWQTKFHKEDIFAKDLKEFISQS